MTDTIFVPSFGNRPRILVGREDILRQFELCLVYCLSLRNVGRNTAVLSLHQRLPQAEC